MNADLKKVFSDLNAKQILGFKKLLSQLGSTNYTIGALPNGTPAQSGDITVIQREGLNAYVPVTIPMTENPNLAICYIDQFGVQQTIDGGSLICLDPTTDAANLISVALYNIYQLIISMQNGTTPIFRHFNKKTGGYYMGKLITTIEDALQVITEVLEGNDVEAAMNVAKDVAGIFGLKDASTEAVQAQLPAAAATATPTEREQLLQQAMNLQTQQTQLDESILNQG